MSRPIYTSNSRRALLRDLAVGASAVAGLPLLARASSTRVEAVGTVSKSALQYQDTPKGSSACANCANFLPGESADATGRCTIVAGEISPQGWCLAYAAKG